MRTVVLIPARLGSTRFPGKPLAPIHGRPMIEHVYQRAKLCPGLAGVYIATCDREIAQAVEKFGGKALMTRPDHERGTERIAEAAKAIDADVFVNVQGDEPMIDPAMIEQGLKQLAAHREWSSVNLISEIRTQEELVDLNQIKVVVDKNGQALYMSRQPIPSLYGQKTIVSGTHWKQVCVIPFRKETLARFTALPQTNTEKFESIDMMRLIENDIPVGTAVWDRSESHAVDTPADLKRVEGLLREDKLYQQIFGSARRPDPHGRVQ